MKTLPGLAVSIALTFFASLAAHAQGPIKWSGSGGWAPQQNAARLYNPATVETLSGEVAAVEFFTPVKGAGHGVHLTVKTDTETIPVHLGPAWFIEHQDTRISVGDKIQITGSRITFNDKPAIVAKEIKKGDEAFVLRDDAGVPNWSGWRKSGN